MSDIVVFQSGRVFSNACSHRMFRVWVFERNTCFLTRIDHAGTILVHAVYSFPGGLILFPVYINGYLMIGYDTERKALSVSDNF